MRAHLKWTLLLKPYLLLATAFPVAYGLLAWVLFLRYPAFAVDEVIYQDLLPPILAAVCVYARLWPNFRLLRVNPTQFRSPRVGYLILATYGIAATAMVATGWLQTATGGLTALQQISDIDRYPPTHYYTIANAFAAKNAYFTQYNSSTVGKSNRQRRLDLYVVCPLYDKATSAYPPDATLIRPLLTDGDDSGRTRSAELMRPLLATKVWMCWHAVREIDNRQSVEAIRRVEDAFYEEGLDTFRAMSTRSFAYWERPRRKLAERGFRRAIAKSSIPPGDYSPMLLIPQETPYASRNGHRLAWVFGSFVIGFGLWVVVVAFARFDDEKLRAASFWNNHDHLSDRS